MVWVKHDDTYSDRPEIAALSDAAFRDHFRLVEYVCRYVTDGHIPKAITDRVRTMPELLKAGLYGEAPGSYVLKGWREHALSTEQVEARKAAGKAGGLAKARRLPKQKASEERSKGSTVPVPVPVPVSVPEPRSTRSSAAADSRALVVQRIWNENRGPLPKCDAINAARSKRLSMLAREAADDEALLASTVAAFASDPFIRERRYGIDTLTRAEHRAKWLDAGRNGAPSNGHAPGAIDRLFEEAP